MIMRCLLYLNIIPILAVVTVSTDSKKLKVIEAGSFDYKHRSKDFNNHHQICTSLSCEGNNNDHSHEEHLKYHETYNKIKMRHSDNRDIRISSKYEKDGSAREKSKKFAREAINESDESSENDSKNKYRKAKSVKQTSNIDFENHKFKNMMSLNDNSEEQDTKEQANSFRKMKWSGNDYDKSKDHLKQNKLKTRPNDQKFESNNNYIGHSERNGEKLNKKFIKDHKNENKASKYVENQMEATKGTNYGKYRSQQKLNEPENSSNMPTAKLKLTKNPKHNKDDQESIEPARKTEEHESNEDDSDGDDDNMKDDIISDSANKMNEVYIFNKIEDNNEEEDGEDDNHAEDNSARKKKNRTNNDSVEDESDNDDDYQSKRNQKKHFSIKSRHKKNRATPNMDDNILKKIHRSSRKKHRNDEHGDSDSEDDSVPKRYRFTHEDEE